MMRVSEPKSATQPEPKLIQTEFRKRFEYRKRKLIGEYEEEEEDEAEKVEKIVKGKGKEVLV